MAVHIEQVDSEIEIVPHTDTRGGLRQPMVKPLATPASPDGLARAIGRVMTDALEEYLRIRG